MEVDDIRHREWIKRRYGRDVKFIIPIVLAACVSFTLFAFMAALIATDEIYLEEEEQSSVVEIVQLPEKSVVRRKQRVVEPPPKLLEKPSGIIAVPMPKEPVQIEQTAVSMPQIHLSNQLEPQEFAVSVIKDNDAQPIYRALPRYPIEAAREKIRGWVKLKFSVNRSGNIENIEILDASPPDIFNQAAIDALQRWKYKAKVIDGKTVRQDGLSVRIDFGKKS